MRALVTGATGFLGRSLVRRLTRHGHDVTALVRPRTRSQPDPVDELLSYGADIVPGTVFDAGVLADAIENRDVVFHLGGQWHRRNVSGAPDGGTAAEQWHVNVDGTMQLIEAARRAGIARLIFTSTVFVYPASLPSPVSENGPTFSPETLSGNPVADYVGPKLAVEEMIRELVPTPHYVILRPSTIYGVGAQFAPGMIMNILHNPPRRMAHAVNLVHVDDVARAAILAAEVPGAGGLTLNIAARETVGSDQLHDAVHHIADWLMHGRTRGAEPDFQRMIDRYDITMARQYLGFETEISLAEGLTEMVIATLPQVLANTVPPPATRPQQQPAARPPGARWRS